MSDKLVSVITPCHNGAKYLEKLLASVFNQTYPNIEMFVIDDGSTDKSAEIITSYIPKFTKKGYSLVYVFQKHQGQSIAVNKALKLVKGQYLVWPDADDYYSDKNAISEMVNVLKNGDEQTSLVRVQYNVIDEDGNIIDRLDVNDETRYKTDLFEDAVFGNNGFWYPPGGYMAKMSKIDELIPNREIYTERNAGQNYQLYLPLLFNHKCITIEKYLYNIVAHDDSHSRNMETNNDRQQIYFRSITNTLKKMPIDNGYLQHLIKKLKLQLVSNSLEQINTNYYRTYIIRAFKGIMPYGLVMLYKRRNR